MEPQQSNPHADMRTLAQAEMDGKAKPLGSLGTLEDIAIKLATLQNTLKPTIDDVTLLIFAADHGFTSSTPGVSAYPRELSTSVFHSIANGDAASAVLCKANNCKLRLVDVGLDADIKSYYRNRVCTDKNNHIILDITMKVRKGSADFLQGPAMSDIEGFLAFDQGKGALYRTLAESTRIEGVKFPTGTVVCIGELGIGNTTSAAALVCALTGYSPELVCGRGTGVDDAGLALKIKTVKAALEKNKDLISTRNPMQILQAVGGLEIAAMVGAYQAASEYSIPAIVDGFISGAAAFVACSMIPKVEKCLFWSHKSAEQGALIIMQAVHALANGSLLGAAAAESSTTSVNSNTVNNNSTGKNLKGVIPILDMGLKLGEGTGAVLAVPILRSAAAIMSNMAALKDII